MRVKMWTAEEVDYLLENYNSSVSITELARHFGCSRNALQSKANRLGFSRKNPRVPWSEAELDLLEAWAETRPLNDLISAWQRKAKKRGWAKRSPEAIKKQLFRLGASLDPQIGWYKASTIKAGLETSQYAVQTWLNSGKLKAQKKGGGIHADYLVKEKDLINFALKYPAEISERITPDGMCWLLQVIKQSKQMF